MLLLIITALLCAWLFHNFYWKRRGLPPGPTPWPLVGNLLQLQRHPCWGTLFARWRLQYGPLYTYWIGGKACVCVATHEAMERFFVKRADEFSERNILKETQRVIRGGDYGIILADGEMWREQRRFVTRVFRSFGMGSNIMEQKVLAEVNATVNALEASLRTDAKEHDVNDFTDVGVGSVVNSILCGYRFDHTINPDEYHRIRGHTFRALRYLNQTLSRLAFSNPWLLRLPWVSRPAKRAIHEMHAILDFMQARIDEHRQETDYAAALKAGLEPRDLIDAFLLERERLLTEEPQRAAAHFSLTQLRNVGFDLWFAGQDSSAATLSWILAHLISQPDLQHRLQAELDTVIGADRTVRMADRPALPYTCAVVAEGQRIANLVGQNVPHSCPHDVDMDGYRVPKGTYVIPQISAVLSDPELFPEPDEFRPERHLDPEGRLRLRPELCPFSLGRRSCLGESIANMELFLFVANLYKRFEFAVGRRAPSLVKTGGYLTVIEPFTCQVRLRHQSD